MAHTLGEFSAGAICAGYLVASLFFFRFWKQTRDSLFMAFGFSFLLLALNQGVIALLDIPQEYRSWVYLLRIAAFALLIAAIVRKNMSRRM
ncbi:MAG TPA: DUF5985 family protein [Rhizomicrobium sp.]|jgi:hypothetical protein